MKHTAEDKVLFVSSRLLFIITYLKYTCSLSIAASVVEDAYAYTGSHNAYADVESYH